MTMKPIAPMNVSTRQTIIALILSVCAKRTARAIVRLDAISTQVLIPPMIVSR